MAVAAAPEPIVSHGTAVMVTIGALVYPLPTVIRLIAVTAPVTGSMTASAMAPMPVVSPGLA